MVCALSFAAWRGHSEIMIVAPPSGVGNASGWRAHASLKCAANTFDRLASTVRRSWDAMHRANVTVPAAINPGVTE